MTADDLQENRRVCKFPCTSRGEAPPPAGSCVGAGASGGPVPRLQPVQGAESRPQAPAAAQRGAPLRGALPGRSPGGLRPPRLLHIFSQTQQPRLFPGLPPAGSCVEQGQAAGRCPVYSPHKAQEAGRRPPLRSSGGRPCGAPCPGEARAACGRPRLLHIFPQRGEALPSRAQQQRLQLFAPQGRLQCGAGQRKLGAEAGRLFQGVILPEGHKIVVLPAQQRPQPGRTAA